MSELNTLLISQLADRENQNRTNKTANATGTVQSIVHWCKNDRLDKNQQIAVEIMVVTYVLTFYENTPEDIELPTESENLRKLARERPDTDEKLRMFITGPAGAGKCKFSLQFFISCKQFVSHNLKL